MKILLMMLFEWSVNIDQEINEETATINRSRNIKFIWNFFHLK